MLEVSCDEKASSVGLIVLAPMRRLSKVGTWLFRCRYHKEIKDSNTMTGRNSRGDLNMGIMRSQPPLKDAIRKMQVVNIPI